MRQSPYFSALRGVNKHINNSPSINGMCNIRLASVIHDFCQHLTRHLLLANLSSYPFNTACYKAFPWNDLVWEIYRRLMNVLRFVIHIKTNRERRQRIYSSSWSYGVHKLSNRGANRNLYLCCNDEILKTILTILFTMKIHVNKKVQELLF